MVVSRLLALGALLRTTYAALDCTVETFASILPANVTVTSATVVAQNGSFGQGASDLPFPANATGLPALCAVIVNVPSSCSSSFNFGIFLPDAWNGRFMTTGNGGYGGGIAWPDLGALSHYGFAAVSTDTGHNSSVLDGSWGFNHPERLYDWGWRAMHGTVVYGKEITKAYYGADISYSYYSACSTGGRQGLKELQLFPDSFDGVIAGAPAWDMVHLPTATLKSGLYNFPVNSSHYIPPTLFQAIVDEVTRQCDPQDGLVDGIISDPYGCNFQFEQLLCSASNSDNCVTGDQLNKFYNDYVDTNQTFVFPGLALGASPAALLSVVNPLGIDFYRYWVFNDSNWDYTSYTYADLQLAEQIRPGDAPADDFDLTPFKTRGGKLLTYHGLADPLIQTGSSLLFRRKVYQALLEAGSAANDDDVDEFYRLFFVPGMGHCSGSQVAPWYFAGTTQSVDGADHSVPGYQDADHDIVLAMMRWVENGTAPDQLIATKFVNDSVSAGVELQRPLCVYPKQAKYQGGNASEPSSWACENLY
ncbi:feruloyl esterase B precursor [Thozetella sp. PMI_491]|nr:feruloyl esterase B precursor [Thozetella sp. PMI_491]